MTPLIDHLWQFLVFTGLVGMATWWTRANAAELRLWMWRAAALKFLLPFSLLVAIGGWLGFPVRHTAIAPPSWLVRAVQVLEPWTAPANAFDDSRSTQVVALLVLLAGAAFCATWIRRSLRTTREAAGAGAPASLGFFKTAALAGMALCLLAAPVLAGAIHDRVLRQEALAIDTQRLRSADISLSEAPHRFGMRTEIVAGGDGVLIHHVNLQDLVALVYGIDQFEVFGGALPWLEEPYYDVRITGSIHAPTLFDPYSLRQRVTDYLSHEYGVAIRVNGSCQEPCLNQQSFTVERLP
jgi:hypothetical protein